MVRVPLITPGWYLLESGTSSRHNEKSWLLERDLTSRRERTLCLDGAGQRLLVDGSVDSSSRPARPPEHTLLRNIFPVDVYIVI